MALSTSRIQSLRGRPPLLAAGIKSLIHSHSSLVRSLGYIFSLIYPFYITCEDFSDRLSGNVEISASINGLLVRHTGGEVWRFTNSKWFQIQNLTDVIAL